MDVAKIVIIILIVTHQSDGARILGVIPTPSYSHQVLFQPLWKELSLRGHQVTVLTTNPINDPTLTNLTEIDLSFSYKILEDKLLEIINTSQNFFKAMEMSIKIFYHISDCQLQHPDVRKLIDDTNQHFDLLIVEYMMAPMLYFSKRFNCPYIGVFSLDSSNIIFRLFGHPAHPIPYPDMVMGINDKPNLLQRVQIILFELFLPFLGLMINKMEQETIWNHFRDVTPIDVVRSEVSLLFLNSDPVFHYVRPLLPSVIPIGGTLARIPTKPLEKKVKDFLDEASEGFIYFSLGSNVKSKDIPPDTMNVILETFRKLPYKILWKYELNDLPEKPSNVLISPWVSQMEVLAHRNIKLFITHGGIQSMQETVSARIPVIGMAFFADQPYNVMKMVDMGFALSVDYKTMTVEEFESVILEVIGNPKYRKRISELADLAEDQPMTGLERAIWWTEYVIRHKGAPHFRSPYLDIPWYQYYFIDVFAAFLFALGVIFYVLIKFIGFVRWILRFMFGRRLKVKNN